MSEDEIRLPVQCPTCAQQALVGFRSGVVAEALQTGQIRLYATCHLRAWEASVREIENIRRYLIDAWSADLQEACREFDLAASPRDPAQFMGHATRAAGEYRHGHATP